MESPHRLLLTVADAAELTSLPRARVRALIASGEWSTLAIGGRRYVPRSVIDAWIAAQLAIQATA